MLLSPLRRLCNMGLPLREVVFELSGQFYFYGTAIWGSIAKQGTGLPSLQLWKPLNANSSF